MHICIHEIIGLIIMKTKMKMKNRSRRRDINRIIHKIFETNPSFHVK